MGKEIQVYVHGEGSSDIKLVKVGDDATVGDLLQRAREAGFGRVESEAILLLEESEEECVTTATLEHGKIKHRSHVHCHRCKHVEVEISYNGATASRSFRPSATIITIKKWALDRFKLTGADAADKVLRLDDKTELKDEDHIGSFTEFPACKVHLSLTALVEVNG